MNLKKCFTWRRPHPLKQARLDYFLISENFMPSAQSHNILPSYRSDHSSVVLSFQINYFKGGNGLWKFNNSLLRDMEYIEVVKECIHRVNEQYILPIQLLSKFSLDSDFVIIIYTPCVFKI